MSMLACWLLFPIAMGAVLLGAGLLVERAAGSRIPGALLPSVGLALVIVVAELATYTHATARVATPAVVVLALAGYVTSRSRLKSLRPDRWVAAAALGVFAAYAAPIVLSGHATFGAYSLNNDTAFQFSLIDQLFQRGHDVSGLRASGFRTLVESYLTSDYPLGTQVGLGALRPLSGQNVAWVFQPYLSVVMVLVALALHELLAGVVASRRLRAAVVFVAAQAGLTYAFALTDNIKEIGTLWVLVAVVALVVPVSSGTGLRRLAPLALMVAAGLDVLNLAIVPWLGPPIAIAIAIFLWQGRLLPRGRVLLAVGLFGVCALALAYPALRGAQHFVAVAGSVLTSNPGGLGNLVRPLESWQLLGIWPRGDYRFPLAAHQQLAFAAMGIAFASALLGATWLVRRRAIAPLLLAVTTLIALAYLIPRGAFYARAKTLAIASPSVVLMAMLGAAAVHQLGRRLEAWLLTAVIAGGVLWTNALAYHDATLAPRSRLAELGSIGDRLHGQGPAFSNEVDEFATYFLRRLEPSSPPYAVVPSFPGLPGRDYRRFTFPYDVNDIDPTFLQRHRLLVIRRSPVGSRPPADYSSVWRGRYYEVFKRQSPARYQVLEHVGFGLSESLAQSFAPGGNPSCRSLRRLGQRAAAQRVQLAYVEQPQLARFVAARTSYPRQWGAIEGDRLSLQLRGRGGVARGTISPPRAGRYRIWVEGIFNRPLRIKIDGRAVGSVGNDPGPRGVYTLAGSARLPAGNLRIEVDRPLDSLSPADGGTASFLGPVVLQPVGGGPKLQFLAPRDVERLCGRPLQWVELIR